MMKAYFTSDGTFGSANDGDIVILDVSRFTDEDWGDIDQCPDDTRLELAQLIAKQRGG